MTMMFILPLFSLIFIFLASAQFPGICKVKKKPVMGFLKILFILSLFRILIFATGETPRLLPGINPLSLCLVFWEDTFFTLPILVAHRMGASRFLKFLMLVISSLTFAAGHLAYGPVWAGMLLIYVPFLSYRYGKKYGLGTVMVCHVLYDLFTYGAARLFV